MGSSNGKKANDKNTYFCFGFCMFIWKTLIVLSLVGTNFMALYSLTTSQHLDRSIFSSPRGVKEVTSHITGVHRELELAQLQLAGIRNDLSTFLERLRAKQQKQPKGQKAHPEEPVEMLAENVNDDLNLMETIPSAELQKYVEIRDLPRGQHFLFKISKMASSVGHACSSSPELLQRFMDYDVGGFCPDDTDIAQKLLLRGCEPLPRRRCFARSTVSNSSVNPLPVPASLWSIPSDDSVLWTHYSCKSFSCLNSQRKRFNKYVEDCVDCFDMEKERQRWMTARDNHDVLIEGVLRMKQGTLRVGLDIGGGSGTFAARMREMNVTVITTTLNLNAPFSDFIAARGLIPMQLTLSQRLPFFDNTLDLIHSMDVLGCWIPLQGFQFLMYDMDRVLRPGGLLWLARLTCTKDDFHELYAPVIEQMGYEKVRWTVDNGNSEQVYLTALLEKPIRE